MKAHRALLYTGLDRLLLAPLLRRLEAQRWRIDSAPDGASCLERFEQQRYDLLLTSARIGGGRIELFVEEALRRQPRLAVFVLAQDASYAEAVRLARCGVTEYVPLDGGIGNQADWIERRVQLVWDSLPLSKEAEDRDGLIPGLVGRSKAMSEVMQAIGLIAPRRSTILISGRTGTGKELVARAIHRASPRAALPMVVVNCGAIPESLMEAEFFGHVKGAFTGAVGHRVGRFEQAHGGTILLDEIAETPLEMQSKLLRVLQEREFQRVGSSETVSVDVRVIAATNRDLGEMTQRGEFREDLYYRLNVVPIRLPSLAERVEDIPLLSEHLLARICQREGLPVKKAAPEALTRLMEHPWPGNVRELENAMDKAVALSGDRLVLYPSDFPLPRSSLLAPPPAPEVKVPPAGLDFDAVVTQLERSLLEQALRRSSGNKKRAADLLRIKRTTFAAKWRALQGSDPVHSSLGRCG